MTELRFSIVDSPGSWNAPNLLCGNCRGEHLHQFAVDVYDEGEESVGNKAHVRVTSGACSIDTDTRANPSPFRHGLVVSFYCEQCDYKSYLRIYQHKGNTFLEMEARLEDADKTHQQVAEEQEWPF